MNCININEYSVITSWTDVGNLVIGVLYILNVMSYSLVSVMFEIVEHKRLHNKYKNVYRLAKVHGSEWLLEEPLAWRNQRLVGIPQTAVRSKKRPRGNW